jgi:hypothetical protein
LRWGGNGGGLLLEVGWLVIELCHQVKRGGDTFGCHIYSVEIIPLVS